MHTVALTELAAEVNQRMRDVFGGNFPALVWQSDCYEYDPAHAHKQMEPILEGQARLAEAVVVLARGVADGSTGTNAEIEAPAAVPQAEEPAASSEQSKPSRRRGGKKRGKQAVQAAGEDAPTEASEVVQEEPLNALAVLGALATAQGAEQSTIEEQD